MKQTNKSTRPAPLDSDTKLSILKSLVNSSQDAIISLSLDNTIISWNKGASKIFGFSKLEAMGNSVSIIIPPEKLEEHESIIKKILKGEKIIQLETVRIAKDKSIRDLTISIFPIKNKKGEIIATFKIARDLAFRRKAEERQAVLAAIVNSSGDAIVSKTLDGIITSWNRAAIQMFGFTEKEAIGKHISLIIPEDRLEEESVIIESIRNDKRVNHFNTIRKTKDGTRKAISLTVSPIKNKKGEIIGASKIARDISLWIQAEDQRQLYTQRLEELNNYKDGFMVMASHELKTPLTVVMANLQILQIMLKENPSIALVNKTYSQVVKLSNLITRLLDVSKIQSGKLELMTTIFDIVKLVEDVTAYLQQTTSRHKIIYKHKNEAMLIKGDPDRIEQVLINIVSNAIKYMPAKGNIVINTAQKDQNVIVSVKDNGIGIPLKDLENIFDRFFRVRGSASSFSGSGIGLYISSEIIKAHEGKIWAESVEGKGSVINFTLPRKIF